MNPAPWEEEPRTPVACITAFVGPIEAPRTGVPNHAHAALWPRAVVTLGVWQALTGVGNRAFDRGLEQDERPLCPRWPEPTRLVRRFLTQPAWPPAVGAAPPRRGVLDPSGSARLQPRRAGRRVRPSGWQGRAPHRWLVGGTRGLRLHPCGVVVAWACATAQGQDATCPPRLRPCEEPRRLVGARACPAAAGEPAHLQLCARGDWPERRRIATVRSRRTWVRHGQTVRPRV